MRSLKMRSLKSLNARSLEFRASACELLDEAPATRENELDGEKTRILENISAIEVSEKRLHQCLEKESVFREIPPS